MSSITIQSQVADNPQYGTTLYQIEQINYFPNLQSYSDNSESNPQQTQPIHD